MDLGKLAKDSSLYLIASLAGRAVGIVMTPFYARFLSPAEYGALELLELCTQVIVIAFGIQAIGDSMVSTYFDYDAPKDRNAVISTSFINTTVLGVLIVASAWIAAPRVTSWLFHGTQQPLWMRVAFVAMLAGTLCEISLLYQRLRDRVVFVVAYSLVQLTLSVSLNIYFIAYAHAGVWGFILSKLITSTLGATLLVVIVASQTGFRWRLDLTRSLGRFGLPLVFTGIATFVIHFSDRFFINQYGTLDDVGTYSLAYKFAFLVSYLVGEPFGRVWNVRLYASSRQSGWTEQVGRASLYLMFFLFFTGLGISIFAGPLVAIVAPASYARAATLIPILVLSYIAREVGDLFRTVLYVNKRAYTVTAVTVGCACTNLALNLVLISRYGMPGAAWATLVTWSCYMVCCWIAAHREFRIPVGLSSFARICFTAAVIFALSRLGPSESLAIAFVKNAVLLALFCVGLSWTRYVPKGERLLIATTLNQQLARF